MAKPIFIVSYIDQNGDRRRVVRESNYQARGLVEVLTEKGCTDIRLHVEFICSSTENTSPLQASLLDMTNQTS